MIVTCDMEFEGYPHPGCAEFGPPDTWGCSKPARCLVIADEPVTYRDWETYGPYTDKQIEESDGYLSYYTFTNLACEEHADVMIASANEWCVNIYVERW